MKYLIATLLILSSTAFAQDQDLDAPPVDVDPNPTTDRMAEASAYCKDKADFEACIGKYLGTDSNPPRVRI